MKNLIIVIVSILVFSLNILSQTQEPTAQYFSIPRVSGTNIMQFDINDPEYKQDNFLLTWQWGNHPRMTKALKMNSSHNWSRGDLDSNTTGIRFNYIWRIDGISPHPQYDARSFTYKPTFTVDPDNFSPVPNDPEKNIWGFRNRNITNPVITDNKLELTPSTSYSNPVLSNPWRCDNYYKINDDDKDKENNDLRPYNGKYWRVSVNLRRKDFTPPNNIKDNAPVLVIKIPYYLTPGSTLSNDTIRFDTKPNHLVRTEMSYTYSVGSNNYSVSRGYCLGLDTASSDSIVITRNMLPNSADTIGPDITITFSFIADGDKFNPLFKTKADDKTINRIDSIGLDVYYRGNCGILLNYIRIGNPLSDKLWKGELDVQYHNIIQSGINTIYNKNYKLFRFYGRDEMSNHYELWDAHRYYNKLVGGLAIIEGNSPDPRYIYRTETENNLLPTI